MTVHNSTQERRSMLRELTNYDRFILVMTVIALIVTLAILWPGSPAWEAVLLWTDFIICAVFFFDFLLNLFRAPNKVGYFIRKWGWLDLLGSIPVIPGFKWTALYRLARLNRPVQMRRSLHKEGKDQTNSKVGENAAGTVLMSMIVIMIVLLTLTSLLVLRVERGAEGARILTGAEAFWWSFVTMTTVGYGDFVPVTHIGRVLAIGLMTFGIGIFAVLTSFMASHLVVLRGDQDDLVALVKEENAFIRAEIAELKTLITQAGESDE